MKSLSGLASLCSMLLLASPALAVPIDYIDTFVDRTAQTVQWTIQFSGAPNFTVTDEFNRQEDSFQIMTWDDPRRDNLGGGILGETVFGKSVIRGEELHYGNGLPVRDMPAFPSSDPVAQSGGWGTVREVIPITLDGQTLRFATTFAGLGVQTTHPFGFGYMSLRFGDSTETGTIEGFFGMCTSGQRCDLSVPIPPMLWPTVIGMLGLAGFVAWRQRAH